MTAGTLHVRLVGTPPMVELVRVGDVEDDFWFALPVQLAPGVVVTNGGQRVSVPLERFLSNRRWLRDVCTNYQVGLDFDDEVREILLRAQHEREVVARLLTQHDEGAELDVECSILISSPDSRYQRELREFQVRDLAKLLGLEHGANFSVPGVARRL